MVSPLNQEKQGSWSPPLFEISQTKRAHPSFKKRELVIKECCLLRINLGQKNIGGNEFFVHFRNDLTTKFVAPETEQSSVKKQRSCFSLKALHSKAL